MVWPSRAPRPRSSCSIRRQAADYAAAVPDRRLHVPRRAARRSRAARPRRRVKVAVDGETPAHRRRRQRSGQRPRRGAAQGAARVLPGHRRRPPRRLQGAHPRRRCGDRGADAGDHRFARRRADVVDDGHATRTSSPPPLRPWPTRSSTRSGSPARSSRRRDERHFTTTPDVSSTGAAQPASKRAGRTAPSRR